MGDTPRARCPRCGFQLKPFWKDDSSLVKTFGDAVGVHQVLYATCACGWAGRVNNPKVLELR